MKTRKAKRLARSIELGFCGLPQQSVLRKVSLRLDRPLLLPGPDGSDLVYQPRKNHKQYGVILGRHLSYKQSQPRLLSTFVADEVRCRYRVPRGLKGAFFLDLLAGTDITRVTPAIKDLAMAMKAKIWFNFNGVVIMVSPWHTDDIVAYYFAHR